ncbi:SMC-Scp complex subunit ScpB [Dokdonella sp.]|uniref:SMC-Scp complex subunit ScpB n=1 Tax=Dokdonella sp. TaxID=2291710 RepID=UPI003C32A67D
MIEFELLKRIIEAALLAAGNPLSPAQLLALFGENEATSHDEISRAIAALQADCEERGIELVEVASGFRYQVRNEVHVWVARLWTERPSRYSRALLETLALVAYRQPITRGEIEQIRGVAVSTHIIRTLEEREWIRVVGHRDAPGKPALFGTTRGFLDYFNLRSLDELPSLGEIRDIDDLDPQLSLGPPGSENAEIVVENNPEILAISAQQVSAAEPQDGEETDAEGQPDPAELNESANRSPPLPASNQDSGNSEQDT